VQGYRGVVAMLPDRDLGIALLWNSESSLPTGMLPTMPRPSHRPQSTAPGWTSNSTNRRCLRATEVGTSGQS
jgi:hypothetical protein